MEMLQFSGLPLSTYGDGDSRNQKHDGSTSGSGVYGHGDVLPKPTLHLPSVSLTKAPPASSLLNYPSRAWAAQQAACGARRRVCNQSTPALKCTPPTSWPSLIPIFSGTAKPMMNDGSPSCQLFVPAVWNPLARASRGEERDAVQPSPGANDEAIAFKRDRVLVSSIVKDPARAGRHGPCLILHRFSPPLIALIAVPYARNTSGVSTIQMRSVPCLPNHMATDPGPGVQS